MIVDRIRPQLPASSKLSFSLAFTVAIVPPLVAQEAAILRLVADGKPWHLVQKNGTTGQITFRAGGEAMMQFGSQTLSPRWRAAGNGQLCLRPLPVVPEHCVDLRAEGKTIIGLNGGKEQFRLLR